MGAAFIAGANGRLGREVARHATSAGLTIADDQDAASVWMLALPRVVVEAELPRWTAGNQRAVIDLSGAFKAHGIGTYGLVAGPNLLWGGAPIDAQLLFANPGCIASAVIAGLERSGLRPFVHGGLHVTAVTAGSAAAKTSSGTVRTGVRWWDHPHVAEIERATGLPCASFVPVVDYALDRGLVVTISGTLVASTAVVGDPDGSIDVAEVQHTAELRCQHRVHDHPTLGRVFTVTAALDNLTFPAANAVELALRWLAATRGRT